MELNKGIGVFNVGCIKLSFNNSSRVLISLFEGACIREIKNDFIMKEDELVIFNRSNNHETIWRGCKHNLLEAFIN